MPGPSPASAGAARARSASALCLVATNPALWSLGVEEIDHALPDGGLDVSGLHEIKPRTAGDQAAAIAFALALAVRRARASAAPLLWVAPALASREDGRPHGPGLLRLGLDPARLLLVETAYGKEALWAIEEGLEARALALVLGRLGPVQSTPARRLSLAAGQGATPCLLMTPHDAPGLGVAMTRWRVARCSTLPAAMSARAGVPAPPMAPGPLRIEVALERCRHGAPLPQAGLAFTLEWEDGASQTDQAHRFRLSASLADRAARAHAAEARPLRRRGAG